MSMKKLNYLTVRRVIQSAPYSRGTSTQAIDLSTATERLMDAYGRFISAARDNRGLAQPMANCSNEDVLTTNTIVRAPAHAGFCVSSPQPVLSEPGPAKIKPSVISATGGAGAPGVPRELRELSRRTSPVAVRHRGTGKLP